VQDIQRSMILVLRLKRSICRAYRSHIQRPSNLQYHELRLFRSFCMSSYHFITFIYTGVSTSPVAPYFSLPRIKPARFVYPTYENILQQYENIACRGKKEVHNMSSRYLKILSTIAHNSISSICVQRLDTSPFLKLVPTLGAQDLQSRNRHPPSIAGHSY
jgi:hypothetical protein